MSRRALADFWSGIQVIEFRGAGVGEMSTAEPRAANEAPTIVGGVLFLPALDGRRPADCELLDVSGRKACDLSPGANDVSRLAPGVYLIAAGTGTRGQGSGRIRRVVILN